MPCIEPAWVWAVRAAGEGGRRKRRARSGGARPLPLPFRAARPIPRAPALAPSLPSPTSRPAFQKGCGVGSSSESWGGGAPEKGAAGRRAGRGGEETQTLTRPRPPAPRPPRPPVSPRGPPHLPLLPSPPPPLARSFFAEVPRRSRALAHLPGPEYGFLGLASTMKEKTIHRDLTAWANEHGPVYRFR